MTLSITVTKPSYDKVYIMQAWEDSNHKLVLVQGEGVTTSNGTAARSKEPRFLLQDRNGAIDLTSCTVTLALHRPDNTEDLLACTVISPATDGVVKCPITASATAIAGDATGEIRVSSTNGTIKFYGIHFKIFPGVSNSAIELSAEFSALTAALQKVGVLTPSGTITLDDAIRENGTDPVSSGVIYEALTNYVPKTRTIAGINLANNIVAGDLRSALKTPQVYQRTRVPTSGDGEEVGQFWIATLTDANSRTYYEIYQLYEFYTESNAPTVTLHRWKKICDIDEVVPKTRTIAGINLADNITADELLDALEDNGGDFANMSWHEDEYAPSAVNTEYPVPMIWHDTSNDVYYIIYDKTVTSNGCAYEAYQIPKIVAGGHMPSDYSGVAGQMYFDYIDQHLYVCRGTTSWTRLLIPNDLTGFVHATLHDRNLSHPQGGVTIRPTSSSAGDLWEEWWTVDESGNYICYRLVDIGTSGGSTVYTWQLVGDNPPDITIGTSDKSATENGNATRAYRVNDIYINKYNGKVQKCTSSTQVTVDENNIWQYTWSTVGTLYHYPKKFTYTLSANGWSGTTYTLSGQMIGVAEGRQKVDIDINESTFTQLRNDGCYGLYVETDLSGTNPVYTLHAIGNAPSATISVQLTVSQIIEVSV